MTKDEAIRIAIIVLSNAAADDPVVRQKRKYNQAAQILKRELGPPTLGVSVADGLAMEDKPGG